MLPTSPTLSLCESTECTACRSKALAEVRCWRNWSFADDRAGAMIEVASSDSRMPCAEPDEPGMLSCFVAISASSIASASLHLAAWFEHLTFIRTGINFNAAPPASA